MDPVWTSMLKVSGDRSNLILRGHASAYVWIAACAADFDKFKRRIHDALAELDLTLMSLEEARPAEEAEQKDERSVELLALIEQVRGEPRGVALGSFYGFQHYVTE